MKTALNVVALMTAVILSSSIQAGPSTQADARRPAEAWRAEHRLIDLHQHVDCTEAHLKREVGIMDTVGLGIAVNLSGGTVTHEPGQASEFQRNKALADRLYPDRFLHYMNLDYSGWDDPDFGERAARQIDEGHRLGAAGFKEFKRLGLYLRDKTGHLIKIDDPKLDPVWRRCGELGMPVSIHVADPRAFWLPFNEQNERWKELKDHKDWWFGDPKVYPPREDLLAALNRVIERHPKTTFVCVHFANNAEDIDWVDRMLDRYPNMNADLAARIPEIGRQAPDRVRRLFLKHQDRIFFATDFQVYDELTLGSGGSGPPPTDADAAHFYSTHWRWLETDDRNFPHMTPIQGDWTISGIGLPASVLRKVYFDNARKRLARSMPLPTMRAAHLEADFKLTGTLSDPAWKRATPVWMEYQSETVTARPEAATPVRALWSDQYLYLGYESPFTQLTFFEPANLNQKRIGLWERDVVEAFIGADPNQLKHYSEYEVAPNGEKLDLLLQLPERDFDWNSRFEVAVSIDRERGVWRTEMRIPLKSLSQSKPGPGTRWRLNLFRFDKAQNAYLAWSPTLNKTFHVPEKFGWLIFGP
jgi:predicted TIM-barrel fold metal-dependent hydrolase